jgi:hypothetical protein
MKYWLLIAMFISLQSKAALWKAENSWSEEFEKKYSEFIETTVTPDYLKQKSISTDCADAVISLRWIFARDNSLPMASLSAGGGLITNNSTQWDSIASSTEKFQRALHDINNATDSKTLFRDLYPVKLSTNNLVPGTVFVNAAQASGHAEWIAKTNYNSNNAIITFYASTVPQQVRDFLVYPFMKVKWPEKNKNGFMRFRWPVQNTIGITQMPAESMQGYSLEQYAAEKDINFDDFVVSRIIGHPQDGLQKLQILASSLSERIENRISVVDEGYKNCGGGKCKPESLMFYNHSTYSRDGAILFLIQGIFELLYSNRYKLNVDDQMAGQMTLRWSQLQTEITFSIQSKTLTLGQIVNIWNEAKFSSDPNEAPPRRWGL